MFAGIYNTDPCAKAVEERTNYQQFKCVAVRPVRDFVKELFDDVLMDPMTFAVGCIWVVAMAISAYFVWSCTRPKIMKGLQRMRGIVHVTGEAAVPGSYFNAKSPIPDFQIKVMKPGLLMDTFAGYGIRYKDILIMPVHVLRVVGQDPLLVGSAGSVVVKLEPIVSVKCNDVAYCVLSTEVWAKLGARSAGIIPVSTRSVPVVVTGPEGSTQGFAAKAPLAHILKYTGSTLPGYSGAAYVHNGAVYGMHIGIVNDYNAAVAMESMVHEIRAIVMGEGRNTGGRGNASNYYGHPEVRGRRGADWTADQIDEDLYEEYMYDPASRGISYEQYASRRSGGSSAAVFEGENSAELVDSLTQLVQQASLEELSFLKNLTEAEAAKKRMVGPRVANHQPQTVDGFAQVLEIEPHVDEYPELVFDHSRKIEQLEQRVSALEQLLAKGSLSKATPKPFPCDLCNKSFGTRVGVLSHRYTQHGELKGESAILPNDVDHEVKLKPAPFLGVSRSSIPKKSATSSKDSKSLRRGNPSTSEMKSQSKTPSTHQELQKLLVSLQKVISGLTQESEQSFDH